MAGTEACHSEAAPKPRGPGTWTVPIGVCRSLWIVVTGSSLEKSYIYLTSAWLTFSYTSAYSHKSTNWPWKEARCISGRRVAIQGQVSDLGCSRENPPSFPKGENQIQKDGPSPVQFCFELALRFAVQCLSRTLRLLEEALGFSVGLIS